MSVAKTTSIQVLPNFSGFLQPINLDGRSNFKLGSTIPVKFTATCPSGPVTNLQVYLYVQWLDPVADPGESEAVSTSAATTGSLFRFTGDQYIFNLSTKVPYGSNPPFTTGSWKLTARLNPTTPVIVNNIQLKK